MLKLISNKSIHQKYCKYLNIKKINFKKVLYDAKPVNLSLYLTHIELKHCKIPNLYLFSRHLYIITFYIFPSF